MPRKLINIATKEEEGLKKELLSRKDPEAERIKRFLAMSDLSREEGGPIYEIAERIKKIPRFSEFEVIKVPEIVGADISFDLFNFPPNHPARSRSDTYFLDDKNLLRTHTTIMWYYYLADDEIKKRIKKGEAVGSLSYGKVYRKDEIDRQHMNVFHQMDGWYLTKKNDRVITIKDLEDVLIDIAKAIFGENAKYRFNKDEFPYTDPSLEMEVEVRGKWVEVVGAGIVRGVVLEKLGVDPEEYNGWAFGFGLERLAIISMELPDIRLLWSQDPRVKKQLRLGTKFKEVSPYPPITRDISFIAPKSFVPNDYFDLIRELGGDLVEEMTLLDKYENEEKFGPEKVSYTYRIVYRSPERTLKAEEVDSIQEKIYQQTEKQFGVELR